MVGADHPPSSPMAGHAARTMSPMATRREGPRPTLRLRLSTWVRHHVVADNPNQGRSGWDDLDHVERPDDGDGSVTDAADRDCG